MLLAEATFDDIFLELVSRYPRGLLIAGLKSCDGDEKAAANQEDEPVIARCDGYACLGLIEVARRKIIKDLTRRLKNRKPLGEFDDEE